MCRWTLVAVGIVAVAVACARAAPAPGPPLYGATLQAPRKWSVMGTPVTVSITYSNGRFAGPLEFPGVLPAGVRLSVTDPAGAPVRELYRGPASEFPSRPMGSEMYTVPAGESVKLCYDLAEMFPLRVPGRYKLTLHGVLDAPVAEAQFELLEIKTASRASVTRDCADPANIRAVSMGARVMRVGCSVVAGTVSPDGKDEWFAAVQDVKLGDVLPPAFPWATPPPPTHPYEHSLPVFSVPAGTKVEKADIDFRWQVWTVLEAGGKRCLVLWNLRRGDVQTVIPWTDELIELGSTAATSWAHRAKVVVAGIAGKPKMTTLSLGCEPAPATAPAAP